MRLIEILIIALFIWIIVCLRIIFEKAWEKWWESLIPFLNAYIFCKIINKCHWFRFLWLWFLIIMLSWFLVSLYSWFILNGFIDLSTFELQSIPDFELFRAWANRGLWTLLFSYSIVSLIFVIIMRIRLWKVFWKSARFCLWLLFINPIFIWILAFDKKTAYLW